MVSLRCCPEEKLGRYTPEYPRINPTFRGGTEPGKGQGAGGAPRPDPPVPSLSPASCTLPGGEKARFPQPNKYLTRRRRETPRQRPGTEKKKIKKEKKIKEKSSNKLQKFGGAGRGRGRARAGVPAAGPARATLSARPEGGCWGNLGGTEALKQV